MSLNQSLVEIETEKAVVELPSPFEGVIAELRGAPGDTVAVGTTIVVFDIEGDDAPTASPATPERQAVLVGYGVAADSGTATRTRRRSSAPAAPAPPLTRSPATHAPLSTPPVRLFAKSQGVALELVEGTGAGGVITRRDVENFVASRPTVSSTPTREDRRFNGAALAPWDSGPVEERIPVKGVVKSMAESMTKSAFSAPHACVWLRVDVSRTMDLLRGLKEKSLSSNVRITPMTILALAMLDGARRYPGINSSFDAEAGEIIVRRSVNLGIAADTPRGLIVPNIKQADRLTLVELAKALNDLVDIARAGTTSPAALAGTTLTITNVGPFGVDAAMPILPPNTGAIVAMGQVKKSPWVDNNTVVVRDVLELAMSFDHRMIDGALASIYLHHIGRFLNDPAPALLLGDLASDR